jgi:hypothetical protein
LVTTVTGAVPAAAPVGAVLSSVTTPLSGLGTSLGPAR